MIMRIILQTLTLIWLIQLSAVAKPVIDPIKKSPFFEIKTNGVLIESFPLLSTDVISNITGPIADITVKQSYRNDGQVPIEAVYVFPGSTKAAVYAMEMKIGDRTITANIKEKEEARKEYNQAKQQGKRTSLLEQNRPNVFTMNVANILPGEQIDLIMKYTEFLVPEGGEYEFVFPTIVGPRYSNGINTPNFVENTSYLSEGTSVPQNTTISVRLQSPVGITSAQSRTHTIDTKDISQNILEASISTDEKDAGNRDFIFNYRLSDQDITTGTTFYDHGDEKFFLSIIEPPQKPDTKQITPREFVFIVDVSGSMHGFPIETSKALMKNLFKTMNSHDYFNIVLFAGASRMLSPVPLQATRQNIEDAIDVLDRQSGGGGTELLSAVKKAMASPKPYENTSRSLVIVTDGYIHVEAACFDYIQNHLGEANFFAFGIGSNINRHLIEGIAHVGRGESFVITEKKYAQEKANAFQEYIQSPVLTNIELCFNNFAAYDYMPRYVPDLLAERPIYVFGKYKGDVDGTISVSGTTTNGQYQKDIDLSEALLDDKNIAIRYLWAREKLKYMSDYESIDYNTSRKEEITEIGLKYNLLSKYTSFIAVDEIPVTNGNNIKMVRQPLPLPKGVGNYAVGFEMRAEKVVKDGELVEEEILFVHVNEGLTEEQKTIVQTFFINQIVSIDDEAKELIEGNTLSIHINSKDGTIAIVDNRQILDEEQIKILETHLLELIELLNDTLTFKITLLWL